MSGSVFCMVDRGRGIRNYSDRGPQKCGRSCPELTFQSDLDLPTQVVNVVIQSASSPQGIRVMPKKKGGGRLIRRAGPQILSPLLLPGHIAAGGWIAHGEIQGALEYPSHCQPKRPRQASCSGNRPRRSLPHAGASLLREVYPPPG